MKTGDSAIYYQRLFELPARLQNTGLHKAGLVAGCFTILSIACLSAQLNATETTATANTDADKTKVVIAKNKLPDEKATAKQQGPDKLNKQTAIAEPVSNVSYDGKTLTFTAMSNGCTSPEHFSITHQTDADACQLTIIRSQPDYCRKVPQAVQVTLTWPRPEGTQCNQLVITNPLLETAQVKQLNK